VSDEAPAGRTALEEQRDFLLRSLDDLEREREAGDVDEQDYAALKDDYTARAAAVLRQLDQGAPVPAPRATRRPAGRRVLAVLGVLLFAGLAGLLVAQASGRRDAGELSSGDIRQSVTEKLNEAGRLLSEDPQAAVDLYDEVLADQPANAEALTYRGWALYQFLGEPEDGLTSLIDAATADREYPDAAAFLAVVFYRSGLIQQAANELDRLESLDPPPAMLELTADIRQQVDEILAASSTTTTIP
jgi:tetratricopeptide (TPR) repeat protein